MPTIREQLLTTASVTQGLTSIRTSALEPTRSKICNTLLTMLIQSMQLDGTFFHQSSVNYRRGLITVTTIPLLVQKSNHFNCMDILDLSRRIANAVAWWRSCQNRRRAPTVFGTLLQSTNMAFRSMPDQIYVWQISREDESSLSPCKTIMLICHND